MLKNVRIAHLLGHHFRVYTPTAIFLWFTFLSTAFGQDDTLTETVAEGTRNIWPQVRLYGAVILIIFVFSAFFYLLRLFQKDKLLKTLLNKYVVFQMKDSRRYRGTMRLEITGMEIISEESRQRGHAPSYIFTNEERRDQIVAYIRYHDAMNERELRERAWELERVYHPPLIYKMGRKIRNMFVALREASMSAISMVFQSVKRSVGGQFQRYNEIYQTAIDQKGGDITGLDRLEESTEHMKEQETYERLIERLVGTRIKVRVRFRSGENEHNTEYTAILKDYNKDHIALMDVKDKDNNGYRDQWSYEHEFAKEIPKLNRRDERGLRVRAEGNDEDGYSLVFENNTPYQIRLGHVTLFEDAPQWAKNFEFKYHINAFSVQKLPIQPVAKHNIAPFERVATRERLTIRNYKKIRLDFLSFRDADIIFPRTCCTIVESAEKYQPELFSLSGLTDTILDMSNTEDIAIADKEGNAIHGINVVHGYVTNVNEERIDLKTIDGSYSRRWDVENAFRRFDNKFRRGFPIYKRLLPLNRTKLTAHASVVEQIHKDPVRHEALASLVYPKPRKLNTAEQRARSRKRIQHRILSGVNATFNGQLWKSRNGRSKTSSVKRSEVQMAMPLKLMALTGNTSTVEFPVLERFEYVRDHHIIYSEVHDLQKTDRLPKTDILWIGNGEIYKSGYRLNINTEHRIKNFVSQGGVVIVSGQDIKTSAKQRRGAGWIPEPLTGVECDETSELFPTSKGKRSRIFQYPNPLNGHHSDLDAKDHPFVRLDDMWLDPLGKWTSLAKTNTAAAGLPSGEFEDASALLLLPFQKGLYIVTSLKNETEADVRVNDKMMENLLHFSVKWLDRQHGVIRKPQINA